MLQNIRKIVIFALMLLVGTLFWGCDLAFQTTGLSTTSSKSTSTSEVNSNTTTSSFDNTETQTENSTTSITSTENTTTDTSSTTELSTTTVSSSTTTEDITTSTTITNTTSSIITTYPSTTFQETSTEIFVESIIISSIFQDEYYLNDAFNHDSIEVEAILSNGERIIIDQYAYEVIGFTSAVIGQQTIEISYGTHSAYFTVYIIEKDGFTIDMQYYKSAEGLTGNALLLELRKIINNGFSGVNYGQSRYILDKSDADPNKPGNVILVYLGISVSGVWDSGNTWNREHVWPQSLLPGSANNTTVNIPSDLHNLKPSDPGENNFRDNKYFDNYSSSQTYEPRDEVKGDVARILLYMITMYDELSLVNRTPNYLEMAMFSVLLSWHIQDPVDDFERNRNNVIYSYQNNRNPYIDYPEFVEMIWG